MIYKAIVNILENSATLTAIVGTKIYPVVAPQGVGFPYVLHDYPSTKHVESLRGSSGLAVTQVRVMCAAQDPGGFIEVWNMKEAVRLAMQGNSGTFDGVAIQSIQLSAGVGSEQEHMDYAEPKDASENGIHLAMLEFLVSYPEIKPSF